MIKTTVHGRAGIIGNPTDGYGGAMVSCSVKNKAVTRIEKSNELIIENFSGQTSLRWKNDFDNKGDYFDIVRSVLRFFDAYDLKAKISTETSIPLQGGLAGSTTVLSSVLAAIMAYLGEDIHPYKLAEINREIELNYLKCQCGYQDAYMTTFGGLKYIDYRGKEYYKEWDKEQYAAVEDLSSYVDELPFVIAHTGVKHNSGNFHRPLRERWLEGEKKIVKAYSDIVDLAREGKKALINKDWDELAYLMNKNYEIQESLTDSGEQNNLMVKVARENGGLAAKLAGAGGGGTIIVLTHEPKRVKEALIKVNAEEFIDLDPTVDGITIEHLGEEIEENLRTQRGV